MWNGYKVYTVEQVANFFGKSPGYLKKLFRHNIDLFIRGIHYFKLSGNDLTIFKMQFINSDKILFDPVLLIFTECGISRFTDSVDWGNHG